VNLWRDRLRRKGRSREVPGTPVPDRECPGPGPASLAAGTEALERIRRALASLPPKERAVLVLAVDEGFGIGEIARALESSPDRVKANLWHARRRMREMLADLLREGIA
jgi:RNA polymerase sigma-70 factor, ECF subfamily